MASTALSALSPDLINWDGSSLAVEPNLDAIGSLSFLDYVGTISPDFRLALEETAADLVDLVGTVTATNGVFTTDLTWTGGALQTEFDAVAALTSYAEIAAITAGTAVLSDGFLTANVTAGDGSLVVETFDLASWLGTQVSSLVNSLDTTFAFNDGSFNVDLPTPFGPITGTVGFGNGALTVDALTPFGTISAAAPFGEDAIVPIPVNVGVNTLDLVLDLQQGNISAPSLFGLSIPLSALDGVVTLQDGNALLTVETPLGNVSTGVEFGPIASEAIVDLVQDLEGTATIANGQLAADLISDFGTFSTTLDLVALAQQGASFFESVNGTAAFGGGQATVDVTSAAGPVQQVIDLAETTALLGVPVGNLFGFLPPAAPV